MSDVVRVAGVELNYPFEIKRMFCVMDKDFHPYVKTSKYDKLVVVDMDTNKYWYPLSAELHNKLINYLHGNEE